MIWLQCFDITDWALEPAPCKSSGVSLRVHLLIKMLKNKTPLVFIVDKCSWLVSIFIWLCFSLQTSETLSITRKSWNSILSVLNDVPCAVNHNYHAYFHQNLDSFTKYLNLHFTTDLSFFTAHSRGKLEISGIFRITVSRPGQVTYIKILKIQWNVHNRFLNIF